MRVKALSHLGKERGLEVPVDPVVEVPVDPVVEVPVDPAVEVPVDQKTIGTKAAGIAVAVAAGKAFQEMI
jgi:hypothetical protein